jgi:2-polyprenyl-6-methoxyphenol hydroxylase-like FAD-dependent oxidoreductase
MSSASVADVAIVGCGPVGHLLAILLGQRGWRVDVYERWREPYPLPRAVHFDHEIGRVLQSAGLAPALAGHTVPAPIYEWRNAAREVLLRIGRDPQQSLSGWPESNMFHQPELERILEARSRELANVSIARGCEVMGIRDGGELALLELSGSGGVARAQARFAIGCDGANSLVRAAIGASWQDLGFAFDWLVVDLVPGDTRTWEPLNWQLCDPARPTTIVSGGPGRRRFEFMRLPGETLEELDREETAWRLLAPWDLRPDDAKLERHAVYTFRAGWADRWRNGRLLLAGDAAHLMPPFAGQGMCSGLRDAANLAWKLDLVLAGLASDALLDTYTSERVPNVKATIDLSVALGRVICVSDPGEAEARDRDMIAAERARGALVPAMLPPLGPGCLSASPGAGRLFVQGRVRCGARTGLFDDVVGRGFALLAPLGDPGTGLDAGLAAFLASLGGITAEVAPGARVDDVDGSYARWFAEHGAAVVLQRPDGYVFGSAPDLSGAGALLAELRAKLARPVA